MANTEAGYGTLVFSLRVEGRAWVRAAMPSGGQAGINVWRDVDSRPFAWSESVGGVHWIHWPDLASYRFAAGSDEITAFPDEGACLNLVRDTWLRSVVPLALQALGHEALHASAIQGPQGIVAFCAMSQTGKSTLAFGLARRGYPQWADDAVVLDGTRVLPIPFAVHLRPPSAEHFNIHNKERVSARLKPRPTSCEVVPDVNPAPLAAVFVLSRHESGNRGRAVEIARLAGSASFVALLTHAYCFNPSDGERHAAMMRNYLDLAATVPVFRLAMPDDLAQLPNVFDEVGRTIADGHRDVAGYA